MNDANLAGVVKDGAPIQACQHCGSANCMCKGGGCPFGKADRVLGMILKIAKIIVFVALAFVLLDIHNVIKLSEKNAEAVAAASMPPAGMMMQQPGAGQPT